MSNKSVINDAILDTGIGGPESGITDAFYGIDHRSAGTAFPKNTDRQGLVLFTRPRLNLTYNNLSSLRRFSRYLSSDRKSLHRAIRCLLDPRLADQLITDNEMDSIVDNKQAFITLLTNTCLTVSGFPDTTVDTYTAPEGIRKESWGMIDSVAEINQPIDITCNFANMYGDPISHLFELWTAYAGYIYSGELVPYPDQIYKREIDYQTRLWRLVLDSNGQYVTKIGSLIAGFPMVGMSGAHYDYAREDINIRSTDQISVPFRFFGCEYEDPILIHEFNLTVGYFNPIMRNINTMLQKYRKLELYEINENNHRGYPRIDPITRELQWWVSKDSVSVRGQE